VAIRNLPESLPPEHRNQSQQKSWAAGMVGTLKSTGSMLRSGNVSVVIWVSMLFIFGFTIMHAVFILYTQMSPADGGLSFSEAENGRVFAMIGITGILTQGFLIGPLSRRFGTRRLIPIAILITGVGLVLIPYTQFEQRWIHILIAGGLISIGNGLFQPSSSSFLTRIAKAEGYELGVVMGAQESVGALARIMGPLTGGFVWVFTDAREWPLDYHTAFHLCGFLMICAALLSLRLPPLPDDSDLNHQKNLAESE